MDIAWGCSAREMLLFEWRKYSINSWDEERTLLQTNSPWLWIWVSLMVSYSIGYLLSYHIAGMIDHCHGSSDLNRHLMRRLCFKGMCRPRCVYTSHPSEQIIRKSFVAWYFLNGPPRRRHSVSSGHSWCCHITETHVRDAASSDESSKHSTEILVTYNPLGRRDGSSSLNTSRRSSFSGSLRSSMWIEYVRSNGGGALHVDREKWLRG